MKAAVIQNFGEIPQCEEFPDPVVESDDEVLVNVKAVALENAIRVVASGTHYASRQMMPQLPAIIGFSGIGELDGQLISIRGIRPPYGSIAEWAIVTKATAIPISEGIDAVIAAAIPPPAMTSLLPLKTTAKIEPGNAVLVNGATGVAGKLAVQIAKLLGAGRVIGTGRDDEALSQLTGLGADSTIDLKQPDDQLAAELQNEAEQGVDIILDYLWGHPSEIILKSLTPQTFSFARRRIRYIEIGGMAGPTISLSADALIDSGIELYGTGAGITPEIITEGTNQVWDFIKNDQLHIEIEKVPLKDIEEAWKRTDLHGTRIVIVPS